MIQKKTTPLKWPEDWRIQEFLGEKITLFEMTGGLKDWRIGGFKMISGEKITLF